jgi:1,4-dihydroxy-2-naphthoate octaprenyltransferase
VLATLVAAPFACKLAAQVRGSATGRALNETLARTARLGLLHGLLLAAGFLA